MNLYKFVWSFGVLLTAGLFNAGVNDLAAAGKEIPVPAYKEYYK